MDRIMQILNMRVAYEPHWVGIEGGKVVYDHFDMGTHEIEARYLPEGLREQLEKFIIDAEAAHDSES